MNKEYDRAVSVEEELRSSGACVLRTLGVSMRPLFKTHRDAIILERFDGEIKKYDVVLYKIGEKYVLHRVIDARGDTLVIRGDNTFRRELVPRAEILAVMTAFNRKGKRHTANERGYKIYSRVWNFIYPVRWLCHIPRVLLGRIKRKFKNK